MLAATMRAACLNIACVPRPTIAFDHGPDDISPSSEPLCCAIVATAWFWTHVLKICRFDDNRIGVVRDGSVRDVSRILARLPSLTYPLPFGDPFIAALPQLRDE